MEDQQRREEEQPQWTEWEQSRADVGQVLLLLLLGFCVMDWLRCRHYGTRAMTEIPFFGDCSLLLDLRGAVPRTRLAIIGTIYRDLTERAFSQTCASYGPF